MQRFLFCRFFQYNLHFSANVFIRSFLLFSFNELVALLQNQNNRLCPHFDSSSELMLAVKYLHQTGHLLHFDDSRSRLNDYFFIQPDWLCKLFAQVFVALRCCPPMPFLGSKTRFNGGAFQIFSIFKNSSSRKNFGKNC